MAGAAILLQLWWYWADHQPSVASRVPNKCHAGDGQQEYVGYPKCDAKHAKGQPPSSGH